MKTRSWTENKMFLNQFLCRCLSKANFNLRGKFPWFAVLIWAVTILFAQLSFSEGNISAPQNLRLRVHFWKCLPEGQKWHPSPEIPNTLPQAGILFPLCYCTAEHTSILIPVHGTYFRHKSFKINPSDQPLKLIMQILYQRAQIIFTSNF